MFLQIPDVLTPVQLDRMTTAIAAAEWGDRELCEIPVTEDLRSLVLNALEATPRFVSAALPARILPPVFHRDVPGQLPASQINRAIRTMPGTTTPVRSDLTATFFLTDSNSYEGGELILKDGHCEQRIKAPAGHLVLYSSAYPQEVRPVTQGVSLRCVIWIQSLIRDNGQRKILFDMDSALQSLSATIPDDPSLTKLGGVYRYLVHCWAQA